MATPNVFALSRSDLNAFLFADIGLESSGMPLSVISALARLEMDPWQEARRLAGLSRTAATEGLAGSIAALPASLWPLSAATPIAARLVALLPSQTAIPAAVAIRVKLDWRWLLVAVLSVILLMAYAAQFVMVPDPDHPAPASAPVNPPRVPSGD
ncbi:MAG: hypothetical protein ACRYHQ_22215 [Janthinobacterium lividum]